MNLHECCFDGNLEGVKHCIEVEKQDINKFGVYMTPLMLAVSKNYTEIVKYLLDHGANPNLHKKDEQNNSALLLAAENNNIKIMELLVKAGLDVIKEDRLMHLTLRFCKHYNRNNIQPNHPPQNYSDVITFLINANVDLTQYEGTGKTPFHLLVEQAKNEADLNLLHKFLAKGISIDIKTRISGETPLMLACAKNNLLAARFLCQNGANVNAKNGIKSPVLFYTQNNETPYIMRLLTEYGADLNIKGCRDNTILHHQVEICSDYYLISFLRKILRLFENHHHLTNVNTQNCNGDTPLHSTATHLYFYPEIVIGILLFYGADYTIKNNNNQTPLECLTFERRNRNALQQLLLGKKLDDEFSLSFYNPWNRQMEKCESPHEYERKQFMPIYSLPPLQLSKYYKIKRHNAEQESVATMHQLPTLHRRLQQREYGKKMPERLYIDYQ